MELKLLHQPRIEPVRVLLIVPYGIETRFAATVSALRCLLIVPYGIETKRGIYVAVDSTPLLIVPYGIETQIPAG